MSQNYEYFGKYILLEKIATGGMAEVWLARAPQAGGIAKFVAIKKILPQYSDNPEFIQMFKDEAKIAMNLSHSNIVSIYGYDKEQNQLYLVMDYVEGRNLRQILNKMKGTQQKFSISQIVYMMREVAAGLDHAHRCLDSATGKPLNITHRDMSPQNIMVSFEGEAKIVDFGIAKAESQLETTKTGTLKGKFGYMSPEQAEGQGTDLRTDIFSLGIVLWELLANDRLFIANNEINTLRKIRECQVPSLTKINPNIPAELERIANKALTRDRNLRYQTAAAMHRDLSRFLNKHDPEFTPHDFAVFVKTLYTDEIMEARKKMMEYAKLPARNEIGKQEFDAEKTQVTSFPQAATTVNRPVNASEKVEVTVTETETFSGLGQSGPSAKPVDEDKTEVSDDNIQLPTLTSSKNSSKAPSLISMDALARAKQQQYIPQEPTSPSQVSFEVEKYSRQPKPTRQRQHQHEKRASNGFSLVLFVALAVGGYMALSALYPAQTRMIEEKVRGAIDLSSEKKRSTNLPEHPVPRANTVEPLAVPSFLQQKGPQPASEKEANIPKTVIVIQSRPSGAEIFINGQPTNQQTPARVQVPAEAPFTLKLKKDRYIDYEQDSLTAAKVNKKYEAVLQKALMAYVDIIVQPARANVKIYVNNELLQDETLPVTRYGIPAKTEVRIRGEVPTENLRAETVVNLREDQRQTVILKLEKYR